MGIGGRMSEIEKLYKAAAVKPILICDKGYTTINCHYSPKDCGFKCNTNKIYPNFTVEKQLGLIVSLRNVFNFDTDILACSFEKTLEETLAKLVNNLWQDLTETEKAEIKRILENE